MSNKMMARRSRALGALLLTISLLGGCAWSGHSDGPPASAPPLHELRNAVPKPEPHSKYGNPDSYTVFGKRYHVMASSEHYQARGIASWYGTKFHGKRTSSGEPYDLLAMTAAHTTLPLPTYAKVVNLQNGREIIVKINDRGPFKDNRLIDLSYGAALKLGMARTGTALVEVTSLSPYAHAKLPAIDEQVAHGPAPKLYLQVGAFKQILNAKRLQWRLQRLSKQTVRVVHSGEKAGENELGLHHPHGRSVAVAHGLYRVQIGPLANVALADTLYERLAQHGISDEKVIIATH